MKWLVLVVVLSGCATPPTPEQQAMALIQKYGPQCGVPADRTQIAQSDAPKYAQCIRLLYQADMLAAPSPSVLQSLGQGMRDAGYVMGGDSSTRPIRPRDFMCFSDCSRRYSAAYCESACSY